MIHEVHWIEPAQGRDKVTVNAQCHLSTLLWIKIKWWYVGALVISGTNSEVHFYKELTSRSWVQLIFPEEKTTRRKAQENKCTSKYLTRPPCLVQPCLILLGTALPQGPVKDKGCPGLERIVWKIPACLPSDCTANSQDLSCKHFSSSLHQTNERRKIQRSLYPSPSS